MIENTNKVCITSGEVAKQQEKGALYKTLIVALIFCHLSEMKMMNTPLIQHVIDIL